MKDSIKYISILLLTSTLAGCGDSFLDKSPNDALPTHSAITNYSDAVTALNGVYDGLQESEYYYGARMFYYGDVRGDDMQAQKQGNRASACYEMNYTYTDAPNMWTYQYKTIRRANNVIKAIEDNKVTDASQTDIDNIYGQVLAIRALVHFDLVRVYGLPYTINSSSYGIPIILEPVDASYTAPRNSVAEVYDQVIADLTIAISKLGTDKKTGFINRWAAKGLLARVYLYKGDYANALSYAKDVIENGGYTLWPRDQYAEAWAKGGNSELLFEIVNQNNSDWVDREALGYLMAEDGYADMILTKSFLDLMREDPDDIRWEVFKKATIKEFIDLYGDEPIFLNKYPGREDFQPIDVRVNNIPVIRLSEIYLIAAEAAAQTSQGQLAANYLNQIVQRANPNAPAVSASEATLERILKERRKELVGEGHRFFDLMRNNQKVIRYTSEADRGYHGILQPASQQFDVTYFRAILPIPKSEIDANSAIANQQNPGY